MPNGRDELVRRLANAKSDIEREYLQGQIDKYDGLDRIIEAKKAAGVYEGYRRKPKPKGKIDARSHKHAFKDASKGGSGATGSLVPLGAAYLYLKDAGVIDENAAIHKIISLVPDWVWVAVSLMGVGWWLIVYVSKLIEKYEREY